MIRKIFNNIISCWKHIPYTIKHRKAFAKTSCKLIGYNINKWHDFDKLLMYVFVPFLGLRIISNIHKKFNNHHLSVYKDLNKMNYIEAIIDWECARYTKSDKQLDAEDTLIKYYPEFAYKIYIYLFSFGIAKYTWKNKQENQDALSRITQIGKDKYEINEYIL
ncbi:MAG: hypothetical protein J6D03_06780 [Clostridia bacterium]|nr:hypothetical protein [Clostridia bacterium]